MEVFTGDHGLPNDVVLFSDTHFSPFTLPTTDTFSDHHKISPDHDHFPPLQPPPQKLRPIRCHVRSFSDRCTLADPVDVKTLSWQPEGGGLAVPVNCEDLGLSVNDGQIEAVLSPSSSEETGKLQEPIEEPINKKKRKRKSRRKMELFFESMMRTVIQKQEEMHKQLIEMLEQKEKESIMREQAWKKQEIARAKRDEHARKQHISQSLALISFIKNTLGQEIQIPDSLDIQVENQNHQSQGKSTYDDIEMHNIDEYETDPNTKRWPKSEVQALITVRVALNQKFNGKIPKASIWDEVAAGLSSMGYNRTPKKCKEKWENINKYYRRTMEKGKDSKSCAYFNELEMLHKTGFISSSSHDEDHSIKVVSSNSHDEDQSIKVVSSNSHDEGQSMKVISSDSLDEDQSIKVMPSNSLDEDQSIKALH
ncbi:putative transcription factor MYB family [Helianthus debilis subsp. tardiflorus]